METPGTIETMESRLNNLRQNASKDGFSLFARTSKADFIDSDVDLKTNAVTIPLHLDDDSVYTGFDEKKQEYQNQFGEAMDSHKAAIFAAQKMTMEYFGVSGNHRLREDIYSHDDWNRDFVSVTDFKNKNAAVCLERSALAHNLLKFGGEDSVLLAGDCNLVGKVEAHSFNVVKKDDGYYIFDPTNPSLGEVNEQGHLDAYLPATYEISNEQFDRLMKGEPIEVVHLEIKKENEGYKKIPSGQKRIYKLNIIKGNI